MARDSRAAYQRREWEQAQRRFEALQAAQDTEQRADKNWWETAGLDGAFVAQGEHVELDDEANSSGPPSSNVSEERDEGDKKRATEQTHDVNGTKLHAEGGEASKPVRDVKDSRT